MLSAEQRACADDLLAVCEFLDTADTFHLGQAKHVAAVCHRARKLCAGGTSREEQALYQAAWATEELMVSLMCYGRHVDPQLAGHVWSDCRLPGRRDQFGAGSAMSTGPSVCR